MSTTEVMKALEKLASPQTRKTYLRHGCPEPFFGVKISDMKTLIKKLKIHGNTALARELYQTRNSDAMYLAGLICDGRELSRRDLDDWANNATWHMLSSSTVPFVAVENPEGWNTALEWIESGEEKLSVAGWTTLAGIVAVREDKDLELKTVEKLLDRVAKTIHQSANETRYVMNDFVIAVGSYVKPLRAKAQGVAAKIGEVKCDMGDTACKVPVATEYIKKALAKGNGAKRKTIRC